MPETLFTEWPLIDVKHHREIEPGHAIAISYVHSLHKTPDTPVSAHHSRYEWPQVFFDTPFSYFRNLPKMDLHFAVNCYSWDDHFIIVVCYRRWIVFRTLIISCDSGTTVMGSSAAVAGPTSQVGRILAIGSSPIRLRSSIVKLWSCLVINDTFFTTRHHLIIVVDWWAVDFNQQPLSTHETFLRVFQQTLHDVPWADSNPLPNPQSTTVNLVPYTHL